MAIIEDQKLSLPVRRIGTFADYLSIARFDHSTKHIFIVPGIILAYLLRGVHSNIIINIILGFVTAICIASANYVINEWLDREFDKYHPKKSQRSAVQRQLNGRIVFIEWLTLILIGLWAAYLASMTMLLVAILFAMQGVVYNVKPLRAKDKPFLDVISESINNPLRLIIGWTMVDPMTLPPGSVILAYWFGGAFLMASKRFSEFREIVSSHGRDLLERYRASFAGYSEATLLSSSFIYGLLSSFFLAVFLIKYRVEYILLMPLIIGMFGYYLSISMRPGSSAQNPEKLFRERGLLVIIVLLFSVFIFSTAIDMPILHKLTEQHYIHLQ